MALTDSTMMPLGTPAPDFSLPDAVSGQTRTFADVAGPRGTLVMFLCNHCPYVIHIARELAAVAAEYDPRGIGDASRPKSAEPVTGADLRASLDAVLDGDPIPEEAQVPSQGCSIKWRAA